MYQLLQNEVKRIKYRDLSHQCKEKEPHLTNARAPLDSLLVIEAHLLGKPRGIS